MTTPTGSPLWTRAAGFGDYGGHVGKRNHLSQGVVDPETDVGAEQLNRLSSHLASIARTAPFAHLIVQCNDTSPAAPTITYASLGTAINSAGYEGDASPAGFPSAARVSDGRFTLTFDSSYTDEFGVAGSLIVWPGMATSVGATSAAGQMQSNSSTEVEVLVSDAGAAVADALVSVVVFSGGS